ncbi:MAG: nucleoside-diphosphate kinase [Candidatus Omnitrophica bacterium]|nr:nucleoside-diphosphate kinase [Candidatus Omnitrophota bacterium]
MEPTLVIIKPDGLSKALTGNILSRLSESKLEIVAAKMVRVSKELAELHYQHLKNEPFFESVVQYLKGDHHVKKKVLAMIYWGENAIARVRELAGATNPEEADPRSIRGSYGRITSHGIYENVLHASSCTEDVEREIKLWFNPNDIILDLYPTKLITESVTQRVWA